LGPLNDFVRGHMRHYRHRWAEDVEDVEDVEEEEEEEEQRFHGTLKWAVLKPRDFRSVGRGFLLRNLDFDP
jgi:transposase